jgi:drug/metabolite transporter (DMT)-like permease
MLALSSTRKGYLLALASTISLANVYVFSKAALQYVNLAQFGFYWFGFAIMWNILYSTLSGKYKQSKPLTRFQLRHILGIGVMETVATVAIFAAINIIPNPTLPAMIRNLEPILIIGLSYFVLNETHSRRSWYGIIITIIGTAAVSYNNAHSSSIFVPGAWLVIISCLFYAFRTVWSKYVIEHIPAITLNLNKVVFLFMTSVFAIIITQSTLSVNTTALKYMAIGSLVGPFFTSYVQFLSLRYIDASKSTLVQSTTGMFTLAMSYVMFHKLPFGYQITGGVLSIIGLALVILPHRFFKPIINFINTAKKVFNKKAGRTSGFQSN